MGCLCAAHHHGYGVLLATHTHTHKILQTDAHAGAYTQTRVHTHTNTHDIHTLCCPYASAPHLHATPALALLRARALRCGSARAQKCHNWPARMCGNKSGACMSAARTQDSENLVCACVWGQVWGLHVGSRNTGFKEAGLHQREL